VGTMSLDRGLPRPSEFLRRLARGLRGAIRTVGRIARRAAPVIGRVLAPIARKRRSD